MRTSIRVLFAATTLVIASGAVAQADGLHRSPTTLQNPVAIIVGSGEDARQFYVESDSPLAPVTAFAGRPVIFAPGIPVLLDSGEGARQVYVPLSQAPRTRLGSVPVTPRRG